MFHLPPLPPGVLFQCLLFLLWMSGGHNSSCYIFLLLFGVLCSWCHYIIYSIIYQCHDVIFLWSFLIMYHQRHNSKKFFQSVNRLFTDFFILTSWFLKIFLKKCLTYVMTPWYNAISQGHDTMTPNHKIKEKEKNHGKRTKGFYRIICKGNRWNH